MGSTSSIEANAHQGDEFSNTSNGNVHQNEDKPDATEAVEEMKLLQLAVKSSLEKFSLYPQKLQEQIFDLQARLQCEKDSNKQARIELQDALDNEEKLQVKLKTENALKLAASRAAEYAKGRVLSLNTDLLNEMQLKVNAMKELADANVTILELNVDLECEKQLKLNALERESNVMAQLERIHVGRFKASTELDRMRKTVKQYLQKQSQDCADLEQELRCQDGSPSMEIDFDNDGELIYENPELDNTCLPKTTIQGHQTHLEKKDLRLATASDTAVQGHLSTMIAPKRATSAAEVSDTWARELQKIHNSIIALSKMTRLQPQTETQIADLENQLRQEMERREQLERDAICAHELVLKTKEDLTKEKRMKEDALVKLSELESELDKAKENYENDLEKSRKDFCRLRAEFDEAQKTCIEGLLAAEKEMNEVQNKLIEVPLAQMRELDPKEANMETHIKKLQATRDKQLREIEILKATINSKEEDIKKLRQNDERLKLENRRLSEKTAGQNTVVRENKKLKEQVSSLIEDLSAAKKRADRCGMLERELMDKTTAVDEALTQSLADRKKVAKYKEKLDDARTAQKETKAYFEEEKQDLFKRMTQLEAKLAAFEN